MGYSQLCSEAAMQLDCLLVLSDSDRDVIDS